MLMLYPSQPVLLAWLTMLLGLIKWALAFLSIGLVLVGLVKAAMNRFRKQVVLSSCGDASLEGCPQVPKSLQSNTEPRS